MRRSLIGMTVLGTALLVGCGQESPEGGPGARQGPDGVEVAQSSQTFQIEVPGTEVDVQRGQAQTVRIGIQRGKDFDQDVTLEFKGAPQGVAVTPARVVATPDMNEVAVKVAATSAAPLGEFKVTVTAAPAREGLPTSAEFQVKVDEADD
jgi:hypothetical protein